MQRHRRSFHEPGHAHELTFSCYRRFSFLRAERTCEWLEEAIDSAPSRESFLVWAYVCMPDHVHLLVLLTSVEVSRGSILRSIKSPVARRGEVATLLATIDSIHANPVRKGLVERQGGWKWSSAAWHDDQTEVPITVDPIPKNWLE